MKQPTIMILMIHSLSSFSQTRETRPVNEDHHLFISAGVHAALLSITGLNEIPYNIHIDKLFKSNHVIGAGYSYDHFNSGVIFNNRNPALRENFRIRYYKYFQDPEGILASYLGLSGGISLWKLTESTSYYSPLRFNVPTFQFLFGIKVRLSDMFFWQTEFSFGAPYLCQTSLGIKF